MEGIVMLESIIEKIKRWRADRRQRALKNAERRIELEAKHRMQIREYQGNICLSIDDIPVLVIKGNPAAILDESRELLSNFLINNYLNKN